MRTVLAGSGNTTPPPSVFTAEVLSFIGKTLFKQITGVVPANLVLKVSTDGATLTKPIPATASTTTSMAAKAARRRLLAQANNVVTLLAMAQAGTDAVAAGAPGRTAA